ncbi:MAG: priA, partial [Acidimicrobiales bacterium]|nr:priA [Acidimicrobiales bacterium]
MTVARVLPDVAGLDKTFDYLVPDALGDQVRVGTIVRVELHGRRVGGWVVELVDDAAAAHVAVERLKPIAKVTGWGPLPDLVDLSTWAAWRWAGRRSALLGTASPPVAVRALPPRSFPGKATESVPKPSQVAVVRLPPAADRLTVVREAMALGDALVLAPSVAAAARLARRLGPDVALVPRDWARAAAGGVTVVGARAAAWAPVPDLAAVVVIDEHDEAYQEERAPTWHGRDVVVERARRAGVPCILLSPCPSLDALALAGDDGLVVPSRADERAGWPVVDVVDRREEPPGLGLYSTRLVDAVRDGGRVVCVLNRTGRARLLACAACGELARCEVCESAVETADDQLECRRCGATRPVVCAACGATRLKTLRTGVSKARDELERLAGRPVVEVTATTDPGADLTGAPVLVGTEAVLHRAGRADVVAFLELDQELLAPRYRAGEQAMALLARAARLVGGRAGRLLLQTRLPKHPVVDAALYADPSRLAAAELAGRRALRF